MNGLQPITALRRIIQDFSRDVLTQRFFHDRMSVSLLVMAIGVNVATFANLALRVRPTDGAVPVHFSSFTLFDDLGPWYFPFEVALVALGITLVNGLFAYHSFNRSRLGSFFLLVAAVVVGIFSFIIAQAFGAVR
jgi:hypothetical protein